MLDRRFLLACAVGVALLVSPARALADVTFHDPIDGSTLGTQVGGTFVAGGGWQAGKQISWDMGVAMNDGWMSIELRNWNPDADSPQHVYDKQHIVDMYESAHGSPHKADGEMPKTGYFNVRTGATYDNFFKFLSSTSGFDAPPDGRFETRLKRAKGFIDPARTYVLRFEWKPSGEVRAFLDGVLLVTHSHGTPISLRYVFVGTDNAPGGTYGPQKDVVYRNLRVSGRVVPADAGVDDATTDTDSAIDGAAETEDTTTDAASDALGDANDVGELDAPAGTDSAHHGTPPEAPEDLDGACACRVGRERRSSALAAISFGVALAMARSRRRNLRAGDTGRCRA